MSVMYVCGKIHVVICYVDKTLELINVGLVLMTCAASGQKNFTFREHLILSDITVLITSHHINIHILLNSVFYLLLVTKHVVDVQEVREDPVNIPR